jgi:hypothetical protein
VLDEECHPVGGSPADEGARVDRPKVAITSVQKRKTVFIGLDATRVFVDDQLGVIYVVPGPALKTVFENFVSARPLRPSGSSRPTP